MLTDPGLSLQIRPTNHLRVRGIETYAKASVVYLSNSAVKDQFSDELPNVVDEQINWLKIHCFHKQFLANRLA